MVFFSNIIRLVAHNSHVNTTHGLAQYHNSQTSSVMVYSVAESKVSTITMLRIQKLKMRVHPFNPGVNYGDLDCSFNF